MEDDRVRKGLFEVGDVIKLVHNCSNSFITIEIEATVTKVHPDPKFPYIRVDTELQKDILIPKKYFI